MAREVWGTFAVNDHRRSQAFLREILLFDRIVVPVPSTEEEHERWRRPNPDDPTETWDPDRLDALLRVLGTQHEPGHNGARLVWTSPWDADRWRIGKARREVAETVTHDAFAATRQLLRTGEDIPGVVEAVAAYPSAARWRAELQPTSARPADLTAADALVTLPRPLLVPPPDDGNGLDTLKSAVDLASDPDFASARAEYHAWLREFVQPLQREEAELSEIPIDPASLKLAEERLRDLVARERRAVGGDRRRRRWTKVEWATMAVATSASVGLALMNPVAGLGVLAAVAQFAGWTAGKRAAPPPDRPLSGASLFVAASREEGWAAP